MIWVKRIGWVLASLILVLLLFTLEFMRFGGQFTALPTATPGPCSRIALTASAEDIQIDRSRGVAYLSALDRRGLVEGNNVQGDILQLDLNDGSATPVSALAARPSDFRPHGMSLYRMGDGMQRLFVISHPAGGGHSIEIFEQVGGGPFSQWRVSAIHCCSRRTPSLQWAQSSSTSPTTRVRRTSCSGRVSSDCAAACQSSFTLTGRTCGSLPMA